MDKKFNEAKGFYLVIIISLIIGMLINFVGISPVKALIYTAVLYGIITPPLMVVILHICNNKKVMRKFTNSIWSNILGGITLVLMTFAVILLVYLQFTRQS